MSYILEALKKAQAERQLGDTPTIHAPQAAAPAPATAAASRKPLLVGLGAGALVVVAGALVLWRQTPAPAPKAVAQADAVRPQPVPAPRTETLVVSAPPAPAPAPVRERAPTPGPAPAPSRPAPAPVAAPPAVARAAPEDSLPFLQQLPDAQQRDIPRVTFGGYMYSANAADRLLIVDKALRHEGEEVAPGLVLEKLLPKAAVMNFRGIRYRVAY